MDISQQNKLRIITSPSQSSRRQNNIMNPHLVLATPYEITAIFSGISTKTPQMFTDYNAKYTHNTISIIVCVCQCVYFSSDTPVYRLLTTHANLRSVYDYVHLTQTIFEETSTVSSTASKQFPHTCTKSVTRANEDDRVDATVDEYKYCRDVKYVAECR